MDLTKMGREDAEAAWKKDHSETGIAVAIEHTSERLVEAIQNKDAVEIVKLRAELEWHLYHLTLVSVEEEVKK
jgi:hypothetical protein